MSDELVDVSAGWYEYEGQERYWNGDRWTDERRPLASSGGPQPIGDGGSAPQPIGEQVADRTTYKVLTQKDRFFGGKFDPEKLEAALNAYAAEGWSVVGIATADIASWGTSRQELVVVMSRAG